MTRRGVLHEAPVIILVMVATIVPSAVLVARGFSGGELMTIWRRPGVTDAVWFSLWQGLASTALTFAVAAIPTWILSRCDFAGRRVVHALLTVPFVMPTVVVAAAFRSALPDSLDHSVIAVLLAHVFFNVAVVVRIVGPALAAISSGQFEAARTLGASWWHTFAHVTWPTIRRAVVASASLVMLMCSTSYGVVRILGPSGTDTVETEVYRRAMRLGDIDGAVVLALIQMAAIIAVIAIAGGLRRRRTVDAAVISVERQPAGIALMVMVCVTSALFIAPLAAMLMASVRTDGAWTLTGWRALLGRSARVEGDHTGPGLDLGIDLWRALATSAAYALIAGAAATAIALTSRARRLSTLVATIPLAVSPVVVGLGILVTYDTHPFDFRSSWWLVPVVHASIATPFACRAVASRRSAIPPDLLAAASTLGASPWRRFILVEVPVLRPALATTFALSAAVSLGEFGATSLLSRGDHPTLPLAISQLLLKAGDIPYSAAMATSTVLLALTLLIVLTLDRSAHA